MQFLLLKFITVSTHTHHTHTHAHKYWYRKFVFTVLICKNKNYLYAYREKLFTFVLFFCNGSPSIDMIERDSQTFQSLEAFFSFDIT